MVSLVERVTGIGGFFFRARDPEALKVWYQERLGVKPVPESYGQEPWRQQEGATAFAPFELDSEMIGPPEHTWMINFRVADLEAMVEQLRAAGESVDVDPERTRTVSSPRCATRRETASSSGSRWGRLELDVPPPARPSAATSPTRPDARAPRAAHARLIWARDCSGETWRAASLAMAQRLWLTTSTLCPSGSRTNAP